MRLKCSAPEGRSPMLTSVVPALQLCLPSPAPSPPSNPSSAHLSLVGVATITVTGTAACKTVAELQPLVVPLPCLPVSGCACWPCPGACCPTGCMHASELMPTSPSSPSCASTSIVVDSAEGRGAGENVCRDDVVGKVRVTNEGGNSNNIQSWKWISKIPSSL